MNPLIPTTRLGGRIKVLEVWFDDWPDNVSGYDLVLSHQRSTPKFSWNSLYYYTLLIDIDFPPAELLSQMKGNNAQQIRRAQGKDQFRCHFQFPPSRAELDAFQAFYDADGGQEGGRLDRANLELLAGAGALALSWVESAAGACLAWHAYVVHRGQQRGRCDLSRTIRAEAGDSEQRNLLGRANRALHFEDMAALRALGIRWYDFGGWYPGTDDPKRININKFKEGFGGRVVREFDCTEVLTLKGGIYLALRRLKWFFFDKDLFSQETRRRLRPTLGGPEALLEQRPPDPASWVLTTRCKACRERDPGACMDCRVPV